MHEQIISSILLLCSSGLLSQNVVAKSDVAADTARLRCRAGAKFAYNFADCNTYYMCVHGKPVMMSCPGDLVFSLGKQSCVFRDDFTAGCTVSAFLPPTLFGPTKTLPTAAETQSTTEETQDNVNNVCVNKAGKIAHPGLCHRYYDCGSTSSDNSNPMLELQEHECAYPMLFDDVTKTCAQFDSVDCGNRLELKNPCDYSRNQCSGPHCIPCRVTWANCIDLEDGLHPWTSGRKGVDWVRCLDGRNVEQGGCVPVDNVPAVFSARSLACRRYDEVIHEQCSPIRQMFLHPEECHRYYDCDGYNFTMGDPPEDKGHYLRTCEYPQLFSSVTYSCMPFHLVDCGVRREALTPCDYKQGSKCDDLLYGSCKGLSDGPNVYQTREGSPYFVICRQERTVEKKLCNVDGNGLFEQFSPQLKKCVSIIA